MLETTCHSCLRSAQALLGELTVLPISLRRVQKEGKSDSDETGGHAKGRGGRQGAEEMKGDKSGNYFPN